MNTFRRFTNKVRKAIVFGSIKLGLTFPFGYLEKYRELFHLHQALVDLQVDCVLDIGANIGQFASDLRLIGYSGEIWSFEPVSSSFRSLSQEFEKDKQWKGFNFGLGEANEQVNINLPNESTMASIKPFKDPGYEVDTETISVRRLEDVLDEVGETLHGRKIFLKIDTQGYDAEVFSGTGRHLKQVVLLMSELSVIPLYENMTSYKDALGLYEENGFNLSSLSIVTRNDQKMVVEFNCLMRREFDPKIQIDRFI